MPRNFFCFNFGMLFQEKYIIKNLPLCRSKSKSGGRAGSIISTVKNDTQSWLLDEQKKILTNNPTLTSCQNFSISFFATLRTHVPPGAVVPFCPPPPSMRHWQKKLIGFIADDGLSWQAFVVLGFSAYVRR